MMRNGNVNPTSFWVSLLALLSTLSATAFACPVCFTLNDPFALPHPRAIEVAVATRAAVEAKTLRANPLVRADRAMLAGNGWLALQKVPASSLIARSINGKRFADISPKPSAVHFLFIDSGEACGLHVRGGVATLQPNLSSYSDGQIVLTKSTYYALSSGRLSLSQAKKKGLVLVEGKAWVETFLSKVIGSAMQDPRTGGP
jgi:hypothetical protein